MLAEIQNKKIIHFYNKIKNDKNDGQRRENA